MGQKQVSSVDSFHVWGVRLKCEAVVDRGDIASAVVTAETVEARGWEQKGEYRRLFYTRG